MMKKRVDREYKKYAVHNAIQSTMNAINISEMQKDLGDELGTYPYDPYEYEEEAVEPMPAKVDNYGVEGKMANSDFVADRLFNASLREGKLSHGDRSSRRFRIGGSVSSNRSPSTKKSALGVPRRQESIRNVSPMRL